MSGVIITCTLLMVDPLRNYYFQLTTILTAFNVTVQPRLMFYFNTNKLQSFFLQHTICIRKPRFVAYANIAPHQLAQVISQSLSVRAVSDSAIICQRSGLAYLKKNWGTIAKEVDYHS